MNKLLSKLSIGFATTALMVGIGGSAAFAHNGETHGTTYQATLAPLNKTGDEGMATAVLSSDGNGKYTLKTTSSSPNLPHAQHIHIGGTNSCPTPAADKDGDGLISTTEGEPFYGPIEISLTTTGDTSKDSGLAVDRFPKADANGTVSYERSFTLPKGVTEDMLVNGVVVTHGSSEIGDDKTKYDGAKKSDIPGSESLPLEATIPATCGKFTATPTGGVGAGGGATAGMEYTPALVAGTAALAATGLILTNRKRHNSSLSK